MRGSRLILQHSVHVIVLIISVSFVICAINSARESKQSPDRQIIKQYCYHDCWYHTVMCSQALYSYRTIFLVELSRNSITIMTTAAEDAYFTSVIDFIDYDMVGEFFCIKSIG